MARKTKVAKRAGLRESRRPEPARELRCPRCGYDLRGSPRTGAGIRCSECGMMTPLAGSGALAASGVPWVRRRWRGAGAAFAETVLLVVGRPWVLAREVEVPARPGEGRRFRMICIGLATVVATACLMIAMGVWKTEGWWVPPALRFPALLPSAVLMDHWYGAVPLAGGIFAAMWLCLEVYRGIVCLGGGPGPGGEPRYLRRRLAGLSLYSAALLLVETVLMGLFWILWVHLAHERAEHLPTEDAEFWTLCVGTVAGAVYLWGSLPLVLRTGRWRGVRAGLMGLYPVGGYLLWIAVVTAINWAAGFVVLGVRSMAS